MSLLHPIHHTFAPHVNLAYAARSIALLAAPWTWRTGRSGPSLTEELSCRFAADTFLFLSGREALCALLQALPLQDGDEVIVQGYTCVVVPNAIEAAGGVPVYADIDRDTLNLNARTVAPHITPRTRAIICQHTFGIPALAEELKKLCVRHGLLLIEDCAHVMPDATGPADVGAHGDFVFFSFGRDKALSGIAGGALLSRDGRVSARLRAGQRATPHLNRGTILRLLLYPACYIAARPLYGLFIGKALLWALRRIGVLPRVLTDEEKEGRQSPTPHRMPNACAFLALAQLRHLAMINDHRRSLTRFYLHHLADDPMPTGSIPAGITPDLPLQKFPLFVTGADRIRAALKRKNAHLDDGWTGCVVCPRDIDLDPTRYVPGSDPAAEAACERMLCLPTHPTMTVKQARHLLHALQDVQKLIMRDAANGSCSARSTSAPEQSSIMHTADMTVSESTNPDTWDTFLRRQPWSPFLQSWTMGEVYRDCGEEPVRLELHDNGELAGICQAIVVHARRGKHLAVPYGPVLKAEIPLRQGFGGQGWNPPPSAEGGLRGTGREAGNCLIDQLTTTARERGCAFVRLSPFWPAADAPEIPGARPSPLHLLAEHVWYLNLSNTSEEEILRNMRPTHRNLIRRAERDGVTVEASADPVRDLAEFLRLYDETRRRHHFVPYPDDFIRSQVRRFAARNECTLYRAFYNGEVVAASVHMHFGGETSYHHGASSHAHPKVPASYALQWRAIRDALARGDRTFNFWGISPEGAGRHPFAGVRTFKTGFGGELLTLVHCKDIPVSKKYYATRVFETWRKWRRGF